MPTQNYFGSLADIGLGSLISSRPVVRIRAERAAFAADGALISSGSQPLALDPAGRFTVSLIPSGELTDSVTGEAGVDYVIEVGRFEESITGNRFHGTDAYRFTAAAGGGNIGQMQGGSLLAVWMGPPWPSMPSPRGLYIDITPPNRWGIRS